MIIFLFNQACHFNYDIKNIEINDILQTYLHWTLMCDLKFFCCLTGSFFVELHVNGK